MSEAAPCSDLRATGDGMSGMEGYKNAAADLGLMALNVKDLMFSGAVNTKSIGAKDCSGSPRSVTKRLSSLDLLVSLPLG